MEFKDILQQILYIVITTVLPIAVAYLANFIRSVVKKNTENIKNEKIRNLIGYAGDAISLSVSTVAQTYVDSLKSSGNFTKDSHAIAKQMAVDKAKALISKEMKDAIETVYASFDSYLDNYIEGVVRAGKSF